MRSRCWPCAGWDTWGFRCGASGASCGAELWDAEARRGGSLRKDTRPRVSILKPLRGSDRQMYESFRSHCLQDYPQYEIIFGVNEASDEAVAEVERLQREFPGHDIRLVICPEAQGANRKVSNLAQMMREAKYGHIVINDSDIRVQRDYLRRVIAPMENARVGMVTALYRAEAGRSAGKTWRRGWRR